MTFQSHSQITTLGIPANGRSAFRRLWLGALAVFFAMKKSGKATVSPEKAVYNNAYREEARRRVDALLR